MASLESADAGDLELQRDLEQALQAYLHATEETATELKAAYLSKLRASVPAYCRAIVKPEPCVVRIDVPAGLVCQTGKCSGRRRNAVCGSRRARNAAATTA